MNFTTPVVLCVFNRPDHTRKLIEALAAVQPRRIHVIADGPRISHPAEAKTCERVRRIVDSGICWTSDVTWDVSDTNLGCRKRMQSGLDGAFRIFDDAIILEDDCIPNPTFFRYCEELLDRYRDCPDVGIISGYNALVGADATEQSLTDVSYRFSRYAGIWGWATWRRVWRQYDHDVSGWPRLRDADWLSTLFEAPLARAYWNAIFNSVIDGYDTWDYSLTFTLWKHQMLSVIPRVNLVRNIGFGPDATHTILKDGRAELLNENMAFPLVHPRERLRTLSLDEKHENTWCSGTKQDLAKRLHQAIVASRQVAQSTERKASE